MNQRINELFNRMREIEDEIEREIQRRRAELHADFEHGRVRFEREVLEQQRRFKMGLLQYLLSAKLRHIVTAPIIFPVFFPLVLMDLAVTAYQLLCFPLYGIAHVRRRDYFVFDRSHLAYLNVIEKINCAYCSYANGLAAYVREVVGRTEQFWCPIKHARRLMQAHAHYAAFVDYGDAAGYRRELQALREKLHLMEAAQTKQRVSGS
jgi:hypothetical protein